jgi:hypothetical protein
MVESADHLPEDTAALKAALIETRAKLVGAEALIEHLQLVIAKMVGVFDPSGDPRGRFENLEFCPFHGHEDAWTLRKRRDCCGEAF